MSWPALKTLSVRPPPKATASTAKKQPELGRTPYETLAETHLGSEAATRGSVRPAGCSISLHLRYELGCNRLFIYRHTLPYRPPSRLSTRWCEMST